MIDEGNPAGRLHSILTQAKKLPDQEKVGAAWAKILDVERDPVTITKAVVELYALSNEVQKLIKVNKLSEHLYLSAFTEIDKAFFPLNLSTNWGNSKKHLTDSALTRLEFCADALSKNYSEETLSEEDLNEIVKKTDSLFEAVNDASLPEILSLTLLEEIERLRNAINMYRIKGAKGLKEALQGTIGAVVANRDELKATNENNPVVLRRLSELLDKIDTFTSRALKVKKIAASSMKLLTGAP